MYNEGCNFYYPYIVEDEKIYDIISDQRDLKNLEEDIKAIKFVTLSKQQEQERIQEDEDQYAFDVNNYECLTYEEKKRVPYEWASEVVFCDSYKDVTELRLLNEWEQVQTYPTPFVIKILEEWYDFLKEFEEKGVDTKERRVSL